MQNLYQGGPCNPNALATGNQYKRLMNNFIMGGPNPQRMAMMSQQGKNF